MIKNLKNSNGTYFIEYAAFIVAIVAALLVMSVYLQRSISGRWKQSADALGFGLQYEPGVTRCYEDGVEVDCVTRLQL